ncbi:hypothetical protein [Paractinoplanes durhamensis]|uniref:Uncharacterized protein n=1 Tax=Paractinoplanes durhamensis TaxID=113563 RepID=A0ABQ3YYR6_9ACTN|nr:hypothetical protein [Actinoplanes durhamensis]GIE02734.1 hypothetical protein Adu01nite_40840 [Actinoplanes durhamensis]
MTWRESAARVDALLGNGADENVVREVANLYGAGLERLLELLHERGALTDEVLDAMAADDLVGGLLLVHGLHPWDAATRITRALAGSGVHLIEVTDDGVCRLSGPGFEDRVTAVAPEVTRVEVRTVIPVASLFSRPAP